MTALLSIDNNNKTTGLMVFENMLYSSRFYFNNTSVIYKLIALLKFLYNAHMGLLKHLSNAVILKAKSLKKDRY